MREASTLLRPLFVFAVAPILARQFFSTQRLIEESNER